MIPSLIPGYITFFIVFQVEENSPFDFVAIDYSNLFLPLCKICLKPVSTCFMNSILVWFSQTNSIMTQSKDLTISQNVSSTICSQWNEARMLLVKVKNGFSNSIYIYKSKRLRSKILFTSKY